MIHFKIVTPERVMLDIDVDSVSLPAADGEITVLPHHVPLVANMKSGEVHYKINGSTEFFVVSSGVIEVKDGNQVVVLADTAEFGHEIDEDRAEQARLKARDLMRASSRDEVTHANVAAVIEKNLSRIKVARKHRARSQNLPPNA